MRTLWSRVWPYLILALVPVALWIVFPPWYALNASIYFVGLAVMSRLYRRQGLNNALRVITSNPIAICAMQGKTNTADELYVLTAKRNGQPAILAYVHGIPSAKVISPIAAPERPPREMEKGLLETARATCGAECTDVAWRRFLPVHDASTGLYL